MKKQKQIIEQIKNGLVIATYKSIYDVEQCTKFNHAPISLCINGKTKQAYGFSWRKIVIND